MAFIRKQDTNNSKGALVEGELGYDKQGADRGRVYVGTNTGNVPLARKNEVDALDAVVSRNETIANIDTKPTLDLDIANDNCSVIEGNSFTKAPFQHIMDVTRSTTGTEISHIGQIRSVAINKPRYVYDLETGERSLLVEEARTNLVTYSEDFSNASWVKTLVAVESVAGSAPSGNGSIYRIYKTTDTSFTAIYTPLQVALGFYTPSIWVKKSTSSECTFAFFDNVTATVLARAVYNFDTDTILQVKTVDSVDVKREIYPNGWVRLYANKANVTNGTVRFYIYPGRYNTQLITDDIYIWGAQLEEGSTPSSYIPTEASAVTRAADNVSRTFADGEFNSSEFSVYCDFDCTKNTFPFFRGVLSLNNVDSHIAIMNPANTTRLEGRGTYASPNISLGELDAVRKVCLVKQGLSVSWYSNGTLRGNSILSADIDFQNLKLFAYGEGSTAILGSINNVKIYPRALTEAECLALTTIQGGV